MMLQSDTIGALAMALSKAQGELEDAGRGKQANGYKYAELATVLSEVRPVFSRHGLAVVQTISRSENEIHVETRLVHESGEWLSDVASAPLVIPTRRDGSPTMTDIQAMGSITTYLRRYSLAAICGITQVDDDGAMEKEPPHRETRVQTTQKPPSVPVVPVQPPAPAQTTPAPAAPIVEPPAAPEDGPLSEGTMRTILSSAEALFGKDARATLKRIRTGLGLPNASEMTESQGLDLLEEIVRLADA